MSTEIITFPNEIPCKWCGLKRNCIECTRLSKARDTYTPKKQRALEWAKFCEREALGNKWHDIVFEELPDISPARMDYILKFLANPNGIIVMSGTTGLGKTSLALGMCECYTRTSTSCTFIWCDDLRKKWEDSSSQKDIDLIQYEIVNLLVIDDFGIAEDTPKFMRFMMRIIDKRLQWSDRGTIITTNLNKKELSKVCGDALSDRIATGQMFEFKGKSYRKPIIL